MGDSRRFDLLASFIESQVPNKNARIADVAAGKGYLSLALRSRGYRNIVAFEANPRGDRIRSISYKHKLFSSKDAPDFDVLVGMHPDQATDVILDEASKLRNLSVFVVPCCIMPTRWIFWGMPAHQGRGIPQHRDLSLYGKWISHLLTESDKRGLHLSRATLPMNGKNVVIYKKG